MHPLQICHHQTLSTAFYRPKVVHDDEPDEQLREISSELVRRYPYVEFYTGHCTGEHCFEVLSEEKFLRLHQFHCGDDIC
jgi:metal-dependent hydrolase (beta-lactamase superfamily II)